MYDSKIIIQSLMSAFVLLVAILCWPKKNVVTQSNKIDSSKTQIKIVTRRINIRKESTIDSEDLGDVYQDEIYDVLDYKDNGDYYWYKIMTNTGIEGFIASDKNDPYVKLISGIIDLEAPVILFDKDYLIFENDNINIDNVQCEDNYSECSLTYEDNGVSLDVTATDERGNTSTKSISYYKVYDSSSKFLERNSIVNASYKMNKSGSEREFDVVYTLNKTITSNNKSISYNPVIILFNENLEVLDSMVIKINTRDVDNTCINDYRMDLKEEYLDSDITSNSKLCVNYNIKDNLNIKYFRIGIEGVENYDNDKNYLANYYSKIYKW